MDIFQPTLIINSAMTYTQFFSLEMFQRDYKKRCCFLDEK